MSDTELLPHSMVVDYDIKWSTKFHKYCIFGVKNYLTFKTYFDIFFNFQNSIRAPVRHGAFATLQIELYRIVNYDSKWSTKFHKDCMLENVLISLLKRILKIKTLF